MQHKSVCVTNIQIRRQDLRAGPAVVELIAEVGGPPVEAGAGAVRVRVHPPVLVQLVAEVGHRLAEGDLLPVEDDGGRLPHPLGAPELDTLGLALGSHGVRAELQVVLGGELLGHGDHLLQHESVRRQEEYVVCI